MQQFTVNRVKEMSCRWKDKEKTDTPGRHHSQSMVVLWAVFYSLAIGLEAHLTVRTSGLRTISCWHNALSLYQLLWIYLWLPWFMSDWVLQVWQLNDPEELWRSISSDLSVIHSTDGYTDLFIYSPSKYELAFCSNQVPSVFVLRSVYILDHI